MGGFSLSSPETWSTWIQNTGIIASMLYGAIEARRARQALNDENLRSIAAERRVLRDMLIQKPELSRVLQSSVDLTKQPLTFGELEYLKDRFVLYLRAWRLVKNGGALTFDELVLEIRRFIQFPLPHVVWEQTKEDRDPDFVRFVKRAIGD